MWKFQKKKRDIVDNHPIMMWTGFIVLMLYSLTILGALYWVVINSFKGFYEFKKNLFGLPETWMFSNIQVAFESLYVVAAGKKFTLFWLSWNSIQYAFLYTICPLLGNACVAYVCAKYKSKACDICITIVLLRMVIPIIGGLSSGLVVSQMMGTYDNLWFAAIFHCDPVGTTFLIFLATFRGISSEYKDAASIDGAGNLRIMFTIMMPMAKNVFIALGVQTFIGCWNDWNTALVWFPSYPTLAYGLYTFQFSTANATSSIPLQLTACLIAMIPMFIIFMLFQDKLVGSISMGGLKG